LGVFGDAALLIAGGALTSERADAAQAVLTALGADNGSGGPGSFEWLVPCLKLADEMPRLFELASPLAPGFIFVGGTVGPIHDGEGAGPVLNLDVAGGGIDFRSAWLGCVGEAAEALSWQRSRSSSDQDSAGYAAGESFAAASLSALLELVERDAAALWWIGGRRPRLLSAEALASGGVGDLLAQLRRGSDARRTWFLDLTTDLAIPSVAALSTDRSSTGFACGLAARPRQDEAAAAALLELCQMELAAALVARKVRENGGGPLSPAEHRCWCRSQIDVRDNPILFGRDFVDPSPRAPNGVSDRLDWVAEQLRRHGVDHVVTDVTDERIQIPCAQVIAPGLQPLSAGSRTARLQAVEVFSDVNTLYTEGIDLI
jgi:hypothetical protein